MSYSTNSELVAGAIAAANMGFIVFPLHGVLPNEKCTCGNNECKAIGKHPRAAGWQQLATNNKIELRKLWEQYPGSNVGIKTGDGVVVLDCDPRHGGDVAPLDLPITLVARTGSGGTHHYFAGRERNSAGKVAPGIDIRGEGGLVVAPPSNHASGGIYTWETPMPAEGLAQFPQHLLATQEPPKTLPSVSGEPKYLWGEGQRNDRLFRFACRLRGSGLGAEALLAAVGIENQRRCSPPLSPVEVDKICGHASRYERNVIPEDEAPEKPKTQWLTLRERLEAHSVMGPPLPTGIAAIDSLMRGGLRPGKTLYIGGAPQTGKTTIARQIARQWAKHLDVLWIAIDEDAWGLDVRDMQSVGITRERAELPDQITIEQACSKLPNIWTVEDITIADAIEHMKTIATKPIGLFVDSAQTARYSEEAPADPRARISHLCNSIRDITKRHNLRTVVTSEIARRGYQTRNNEDGNKLSYFAEARAIEYSADSAAILLPSDDDDIIDLHLVKCRMGRKGSIGLRLNQSTASFGVA